MKLDELDEKCECGEFFTKKDLDGGRCLSCGSMICAIFPEKSKQMEFEEWAKNLPDPGPVLAGGPMHFNSPKTDLGPFRDPSTPSEEEETVKLTEVCSTDEAPQNTRILCLNFYARYEVPLYVTYLGNRSHFFVEIEQDSYVVVKYAAFISGYLAGQK